MPTSFLPTNRGTTSSSKHQLDGISGLLVLVQLWVFTLDLLPLSVRNTKATPSSAGRAFLKYDSTAAAHTIKIRLLTIPMVLYHCLWLGQCDLQSMSICGLQAKGGAAELGHESHESATGHETRQTRVIIDHWPPTLQHRNTVTRTPTVSSAQERGLRGLLFIWGCAFTSGPMI